MFGLGGDRLPAQGAHLLAHVRDLAVVGLVEVLRTCAGCGRVFHGSSRKWTASGPTLAVLIDYADFNLRLARAAAPTAASPSSTTSRPRSGPGAAAACARSASTVSHMIVIFPFEEALYREAGVPVTFVGHPLVDLVQPTLDRAALLAAQGLDPARPVVALLARQPGAGDRATTCRRSRRRSALLRQQRPDLQFALAVAPVRRSPLDAATALGDAPVRARQRAHPRVLRACHGRHRGLGHGHRRGGAAGSAHGRRLPALAAHLRARPALRAGAALRDGQPDRRAARAHRADPGRLPAGHRGGRGGPPPGRRRSGEPRSRTGSPRSDGGSEDPVPRHGPPRSFGPTWARNSKKS